MMVWKVSATSTPIRRVRLNASRRGTESSVSIGPAMVSQAIGLSVGKVGNPKDPSDWFA